DPTYDPKSWPIKGQWLNVGPLETECKRPLSDGEEAEVYESRTRALILWCCGSFFFPDQRANGVSLYWLPKLLDMDSIKGYSWGSAVLAFLYRGLCKAFRAGEVWLKGCVQLLQ
ncbi:Aminotransferase-like- plant mobile domain family protein, partial [Striga hermonthica]